ncbi:beta-galactosidase [Marinomonas sp. TI.3.20]|uniref:beta-galactosidase n=1 Tax=Marinomonas sp. TI.3.20 TaxID=3121296 RepID=UPI003120289D
MDRREFIFGIAVTALWGVTAQAHTQGANSLLAPLDTESLAVKWRRVLGKEEILRQLVAGSAKGSFDTTREQMVLHTSGLFKGWIDYDAAHVALNTQHFRHSPQYKASAATYAAQLPHLELMTLEAALDNVTANFRRVLAGEVSRRSVIAVDYKAFSIQGRHFVQAERPVFPLTYTWLPKDPGLNRYFGDLNSVFLSPTFVEDEAGHVSNKKLKAVSAQEDGRIGQVFINHHAIPEWIIKKYPDITVGRRHYSAYDIDHPAARGLFADLFRAFVPLVREKRMSALGYMMFNEPSFFTMKDTWNTGPVSSYTMAKFRKWLAVHHRDVAVLNRLWGSGFSSFEAVSLAIPIDGALRGQPVWYDWCAFNQYRVSDWFAFLVEQIKSLDSHARNHIKLMPWLWTSGLRDHGLNYERLIRMCDIIGFDAQSQYSSIKKKRTGTWLNKYSFDWQNLIMIFDFFSSIQPDELLWDSENHFFLQNDFSEMDTDPAYLRAIYWLAHVHGLGGASTWVWGRAADGATSHRNDSVDFVVDPSHQPQALIEMTLTNMDVNAHGDAVVALQAQRKAVRIFYSETSAINRYSYMDDVHLSHAACFFEGVALGFVTQDILNSYGATAADERLDWDMVVVMGAHHVTDQEVQALQAYLDRGGRVVIDGDSLSLDEYGRPRQTALHGLSGHLIRFDSLTALTSLVTSYVEHSAGTPVCVTQTIHAGAQPKGTCVRTAQLAEGQFVVSLVQVGLMPSEVRITHRVPGKKWKLIDGFTGESVAEKVTISPRKVMLINCIECS